jgi:hypothetical protein
MRNLTLTIHFCDISQSFVSATKYENTSNNDRQRSKQNSKFTQKNKNKTGFFLNQT